MPRRVEYHDLSALLAEIDFPTDAETLAAAHDDVVLGYADGEEPFGDVLARIDQETFETREDLELSVRAAVPTEAVGEPGQSEGEG